MFENFLNRHFTNKKGNRYNCNIESLTEQILKKELSDIKIASLLVLMKKHKNPYVYKKVLQILDRHKKFDFKDEKSVEIAYPYNLKKKSPYFFIVSAILLSVLEKHYVKCVFHGDDVYEENTKDVFDYLNISFLTENEAIRTLRNLNLTFIKRKLFLPSLANINNIRKDLNIKDTFYYIERFTNPLKSQFLITGVKNENELEIFSHILKDRYKRFAIVVGDEEGFPDIYKPTQIIHIFESGERKEEIYLDRLRPNLFEKFNLKFHINFIENIFANKRFDEYKEYISVNGALILYITSAVSSIEEGKEIVFQLIEKYNFLDILKNIQFYTNYLNFKNIYGI